MRVVDSDGKICSAVDSELFQERPRPLGNFPSRRFRDFSRPDTLHSERKSWPNLDTRPESLRMLTIGPLVSTAWTQPVEKGGRVADEDIRAGLNTRFCPGSTRLGGAPNGLSGSVAGSRGFFQQTGPLLRQLNWGKECPGFRKIFGCTTRLEIKMSFLAGRARFATRFR